MIYDKDIYNNVTKERLGVWHMKHYRNPESVHPPLAAYTHQVEIVNPQRQLIVSGQVGMNCDGTMPESAEE